MQPSPQVRNDSTGFEIVGVPGSHRRNMQKALTLLDTTIGKKAVMAVTGLVLFGFLIGHMLGNLQIFLGPEVLDAYAEKLQSMGPLLWGVRTVLAISLVLHVWMVLDLYARSLAARPVSYRVTRSIATNYAAKTMWLSGVVILLFVLYHIAHFTFPGIAMGNYEHDTHGQVYLNVVNGFCVRWVAALYIAAQLVLWAHLFHGAWSLLQTLGLNHPRYNDGARRSAKLVATVIVLGNISIPVAVMAGIVK
jgi:succinate dehydrogenase / fumarate reductase cytochrome b subunit